MSQYDFKNIDHQEFEELARDILNRVLKIELQSFKAGRDGGIDLNYATPSHPHEVVVQVKHYANSSFNNLLLSIEAEKPKIDKFLPSRYLVVTSLSLTLSQSKKIKEVLEPYIKDTNDIFDKTELNKYLARNPDIVQQYFKLWLTSTTVLKTIINNAQYAGSKFVAEKIKKNVIRWTG
jgi:hypothetical protein